MEFEKKKITAKSSAFSQKQHTLYFSTFMCEKIGDKKVACD